MAESKNISLPVVNLKGEKVSTVSLSKEVFGVEENAQVIHDAVLVYQANLRQDTAKVKTRSEVSGGGKKPWSQKGTGRARSGSSRSPIWVGGGTVFGPTGNQNHTIKQNRKEHKLALKGCYSSKAKDGLIIIDEWKLDSSKTKDFAKALENVKSTGKTLIILGTNGEFADDKIILPARNIPNVILTRADNVSVYDLLYFDHLVVSKSTIKEIEEALK